MVFEPVGRYRRLPQFSKPFTATEPRTSFYGHRASHVLLYVRAKGSAGIGTDNYLFARAAVSRTCIWMGGGFT